MDFKKPFLRFTMYSLKKSSADDSFYHGDIPVKYLETLVEGLGVRHEVVLPYDNKWGSRLPNGTWNGMVGMVNRSEVEFALGLFSITPERNAAVTYTHPFRFDNSRLVTPRPTFKNDVAGFVKPFTWEVWIAMLAALTLVTMAMILLERMEGFIFKYETKHLNKKILSFTLKALTQEGSEWLPKRSCGRLAAMIWLLSCLVFITSYSGILTAMLSIPKAKIPIDSLTDLVGQSKVSWRLSSGSFVTGYLRDSDDPVLRETYTRRSGFITGSCSASMSDIVQGKFATICYEFSLRRFIWNHFRATGKCTLYIAREKVYSDDMMALIFRPNSEYYKRANFIIRSLTEMGLFDKWYRRSVPTASECFRSPVFDRSDAIAALNLETLGGPFLLLIGGFLISSLAFMFELLCFRKRDEES